MRESKHSEGQIIGPLKRAEQGVAVKDIYRKLGIRNATCYQWRSTYSSLEASDLHRLKELETENRRLKQMYADLSLEQQILKVSSNRALTASVRRDLDEYAMTGHAASERRACRLMGLSRSAYRYQAKR